MKNYLEINKNAYEQAANEYQERIKDYKVSDIRIMQPFIDYIKSKFKDAKILELGPGSGLGLKILSKAGFKTTAIEISPKMIEVAKQTSPETEFINDDFLSHDFENSKYEGIFAKAFIHLFPKSEAKKVLTKIKNLLNKDGAAYITTTLHNASDEGFMEKEDYSNKPRRFRKKWTERELLETIGLSGFKIVLKEHHIEEKRNKLWICLIIK